MRIKILKQAILETKKNCYFCKQWGSWNERGDWAEIHFPSVGKILLRLDVDKWRNPETREKGSQCSSFICQLRLQLTESSSQDQTVGATLSYRLRERQALTEVILLSNLASVYQPLPRHCWLDLGVERLAFALGGPKPLLPTLLWEQV